jgi:hypothetical protein
MSPLRTKEVRLGSCSVFGWNMEGFTLLPLQFCFRIFTRRNTEIQDLHFHNIFTVEMT